MPRRFLEKDPLVAELDAEEDAESVVMALAKRYKISAHAISIRLGSLALAVRQSNPLMPRQQ